MSLIGWTLPSTCSFLLNSGRPSSLSCCIRCCHTKPRQKLRSYLVTRYLEYLKKYETALEVKFPRAVSLYRVFSVGIKEFQRDLKCLFQVFKKSASQQSLSRRELEVSHMMPKDMVKVAPILLMTVLPGGGVIFPVAYMFPRILLSHHFWSLQQRNEFAMAEQKRKLAHFRPVFRCLQSHLRSIKDEPEQHRMWSKVLGLLGSGVHPDPELLVECKHLFERKPYHIPSLSALHVSHLLQIHGMHRGWFRRTRLEERADLLMRMDRAIENEGGPETLSMDQLRWTCLFRGLNPANVDQRDATEWLHRWLFVSRHTDENSYSLLLHCPVLLGYNEPSNWLLLHDNRTFN